MAESPVDAYVCLQTIENGGTLPQSSRRRQSLAISAGICSESALLAFAAGHGFLAAMLGATSSAVLSWSFATSKADDPATVRQVAAQTLFAFALVLATTFTLVPRLRRMHLFRGFGAPSDETSQADASSREHGHARPDPDDGSLSGVRDAYSGIVLWPKKEPVTKLIAPAPLSWTRKWASAHQSSPLIIPFEGVYWFFRRPDAHPPAKSREAQGSPDMFDIHSTDWRALSMEAHQNLGEFVDLSCCSRIEIAIRNGDHYPKSVSIELALIDNSSAGRPSESLGRESVNSSRPWKMYDDQPPTTETLKFAIPQNRALKRFDEIAIIFRLEGYRARTGAKIGIDHFTLVPRGL